MIATRSSTKSLKTGLERCLTESPPALKSARLGLLMNQASLDGQLRYACDVLSERFPGQLTAIFSPQHGIWGEQQANMIESEHSRHAELGLPVYSLYSETRRPTPEMLADIDCLVIDLQDVGTRVYTFVWTMLECMQACQEAGKSVVILDRPNPLGGEVAEGPMLAAGFESFVGKTAIPLRHGLTMAELAQLLNAELQLEVDLHCVPVEGWTRQMAFEQAVPQWVWPSPNMPSLATACVYPGQVLLEGTNLSEGRGTTRPFEVVGAPFLDPQKWLAEVQRLQHPGLCLRPLRFRPTFDKWSGQSCGGIDLHITQAQAVRSVATTVTLIAAAAKLAPTDFRWLDPPYEYEFHKPPIDILFGSPALREYVERVRAGAEIEAADIDALVGLDTAAWQARIRPHLLYA